MRKMLLPLILELFFKGKIFLTERLKYGLTKKRTVKVLFLYYLLSVSWLTRITRTAGASARTANCSTIIGFPRNTASVSSCRTVLIAGLDSAV